MDSIQPLPPLSYINYSADDLNYQIEQFKEDEDQRPQDAKYDDLMIALRERHLEILKEHPHASPDEIEKLTTNDETMQKLEAELNEIPSPKYFVDHGIKMFAPKN